MSNHHSTKRHGAPLATIQLADLLNSSGPAQPPDPPPASPDLAAVLAAGNDAGTVPVRFAHDAGNYQELVMVPAMGGTAGILRLRGQFQGNDMALLILGTTNTLGLTATPGGCQISFDNGAGRITGLSDPFNDQDADTLAARNAAIASALNGLTQNVTIDGVTLHFTNGLLTGVS